MWGIGQLQYKESMLDNASYKEFKTFAEKVVDGEIVDLWYCCFHKYIFGFIPMFQMPIKFVSYR